MSESATTTHNLPSYDTLNGQLETILTENESVNKLSDELVVGDNAEEEIVGSSTPTKNDQEKPPKRRRSVMTLQQKLDIIARLKNGEKMTKLAKEYNVGKATLSGIKSQEEQITTYVTKMEAHSSQVITSEKRRTMRRPQDELVERALYMWLTREREKAQANITGPILMKKAKDFHRHLYGEDGAEKFKASTGWLHRFKQRNGVQHKKIPKTKTPVDSNTQLVERQLTHLRTLIRSRCLCPDQIYSVTRTRLHWRALPGAKDSDGNTPWSSLADKTNRDCLDVIGCVNFTGNHRLRLTLVGRHTTPWVSSSTNASKMPFCYYSSEEGSLSPDIFLDWFHKEFVVAIQSFYANSGLAATAILLLDDTAFVSIQNGLNSENGHIQGVPIPSATAFLIQPVNHFHMENIRRNYRRKLIARILTLQPQKRLHVQLKDLATEITVKDAGYMLSEVWSEVSGETVLQLCRDTLYCLGVVDEQAAVVGELLKIGNDNRTGGENDAGYSSSGLDNTCSIFSMLRDRYPNIKETEVAHWLSLDSEDPSSCTSDMEILEHIFDAKSTAATEENKEEVETKSRSGRSAMNRNISDGSVTTPSDAEAYACFAKCLTWLEVQPDCETTDLQLLWKLQSKVVQKRN